MIDLTQHLVPLQLQSFNLSSAFFKFTPAKKKKKKDVASSNLGRSSS